MIEKTDYLKKLEDFSKLLDNFIRLNNNFNELFSKEFSKFMMLYNNSKDNKDIHNDIQLYADYIYESSKPYIYLHRDYILNSLLK